VMLRAYVSPYQNHWDKHLTAAEFAYNNSEHASTKFTPFFLMYGEHPNVPLAFQAVPNRSPRADSADTLVRQMAQDLQLAKSNLAAAKQRQADRANRHRRQHVFAPGDKVLLAHTFTSGLPAVVKVGDASSKLGARGWGPFVVEQVLSDSVVRVKLPSEWRMHPTVHVSYLTPWRDSAATYPDRLPIPPDPDVLEGEEYFYVKAIRNYRWRRGSLWYLVKWRGYPEEENTWLLADQVQEDCADTLQLVEAFRVARGWPSTFSQRPETVAMRRSVRLASR
jgi:hypothetical protein